MTAPLDGMHALAGWSTRRWAAGSDDTLDDIDRPARAGGIGRLLSSFAIGCPTCNKLAVLALGSTGALDWFAPALPLLAVVSLVLLALASRARLRCEMACRVAV